jgi:nitroimidazol reductase NimA-like FMN-containing flavoprotein (pyridoxamine 5'-phosphate oxidase superfamily)
VMASMHAGDPVLEELSRAECLRLLATATIGRIGYTRQALPAVEPVNFALHDGVIVIRTNAGGKLAAATRRAVVAFQADDLDPVLRSGWSVTVVGVCEEVTDAGDIARLDNLGLESWAPGTRDRFIHIEPGIVTGRRLRGPDPATGPGPAPVRPTPVRG